MRLEHYSLFRNLTQLRKRHHLKPAGISEYRPLPVHEFMQAAHFSDNFRTGTQHQMVGIAQDNIRSRSAHGFW